jgi:hypothetical protein
MPCYLAKFLSFIYNTDVLRLQKFTFFMIIAYKSYDCYILTKKDAKMVFFYQFACIRGLYKWLEAKVY